MQIKLIMCVSKFPKYYLCMLKSIFAGFYIKKSKLNIKKTKIIGIYEVLSKISKVTAIKFLNEECGEIFLYLFFFVL